MPIDTTSIAKLKFKSCKIKDGESLSDITISDFISLDASSKSNAKSNLFCPDCEEASLVFVNAHSPYFRTRKKSLHSEICGKAIASTIRNINEIDEESVKRILNKIISRSLVNKDSSHRDVKLHFEQRNLSKLKSKSILTVTDEDDGLYYCFYARGVKLELISKYDSYDYVWITKRNEATHSFSLKIRKDFMYNFEILSRNNYDIAFFGKMKISKYRDIYIENPAFLLIKSISI